MEPVTLHVSSGEQRVDEILRGFVGVMETVFPDRVRSYYLTGSFADRQAKPGSDIDLCLLVRGGFQDAEEEEQATQIVRSCALISPVELDVALLGEEIPYPLRAVSLKRASLLV